ncbi:MAG: hypothetical protein VX738_02640 [Planctomycetota bacterium]|nr:hypothetical protein [Planctomycetota bacterium]
MKLQHFLEHHGISRNPFAEEDAKSDKVFKEHCIINTYHPTWDKVFGDPSEPSTSVIFGEKGSGKTAICLQIARHIESYNRQNPEQRVFVIHYDDFNPFLDRFRDQVHGRNDSADKVLKKWRLWDHMDAILTAGVTGLVDDLLETRGTRVRTSASVEPQLGCRLDRHQMRDLLLLAACYDESTQQTFIGRWHQLRKSLGFSSLGSQWQRFLGIGYSLLSVVILVAAFIRTPDVMTSNGFWFMLLGSLAFSWTPWCWKASRNLIRAYGILQKMRIGNREAGSLRKVLMNFSNEEIAAQPLPDKDNTDDRYELLMKFQSILHTLGFNGILVLVDRVDEPHLINGSAELMKELLWPMLDNKFLKQMGIGIKLMLPIELSRFIEKEDRQFYQRARLDKQNMIKSFGWTGESLIDVANARLQACSEKHGNAVLRDLFDESVSNRRILDVLKMLRVPRHLFKFLYQLCVDHCNSYTDQSPCYEIDSKTFESTLAVFLHEQNAFEHGVAAG